MSDGGTGGDTKSQDEVVTLANTLNTPIYSIYIGSGENPNMIAISARTNGIYYNVAALDVGIVRRYQIHP